MKKNLLVLFVLSVISVPSLALTATEDALYYYSQGEKYRLSEQYDSAIPMYQKAIELKPDYELAFNNLGCAYYGKRSYDEAISAYKKALEINPNSKLTHNNLGCAYFYKKMYEEAIDEFKKELANNPNCVDAINGIGYAYQQKEMYEEAIKWYKQALEKDPDSTVAKDKLEFTQKLLGEKGSRENYRIWNNLAVDMLNQNKWEEAIENFNKAYEYATKEEKEVIKGRIEEAKSNLTEKSRQENYRQWVDSGIEQISKNELDKAIEHFNKALEYAKTDEEKEMVKKKILETKITIGERTRKEDYGKWVSAGIDRVQKNKLDDAIDCFNNALGYAQTDEEKEIVTKKIAEAKTTLTEKTRQEDYGKWVSAGIDRVQKNKLDDAIDCFNNALGYAKTDEEKETVTKKITEAKTTLTEKTRQENYTRLFNAGVEMMNDNRWEKAIDCLNKASAYALPNEKEMIQGKINEAQLALNEKIRRENYWKWYSAGIAQVSENNLKQAAESFDNALKYAATTDEKDKIMEKLKVARDSMDKKQNWEDYQKWVDVGINQMLHQSWENAREIFTRAFECAPTQEEKEKIKGILNEIDKREQACMGKKGQANLQVAKASVLPLPVKSLPGKPVPGKPDLKGKEQACLVEVNYLPEAAVAIFCLVLLFLFPKFNLLLARIYICFRNWTKAAKIYEKAVFKDKKMWLYPKLAEVYLKSDRRDEQAMRVYDRAIYFNPGNSDLVKIVSDHYLKQGKIGERAVEVYEEALKFEPNNIQLLRMLVMIHTDSNNGNGKKAVALSRKLNELSNASVLSV